MASGSVGSSGPVGQGFTPVNILPDEKRIRELAEQIRVRLAHAHQLKLAVSQQQQVTPAATMQVRYLTKTCAMTCMRSKALLFVFSEYSRSHKLRRSKNAFRKLSFNFKKLFEVCFNNMEADDIDLKCDMTTRLKQYLLFTNFFTTDFSLSGIHEWLGVVAQRLGLKLDLQRSQQLPGATIFLIHEGFYVEVCCQDNGIVTSVKLSQANTPQVSSIGVL